MEDGRVAYQTAGFERRLGWSEGKSGNVTNFVENKVATLELLRVWQLILFSGNFFSANLGESNAKGRACGGLAKNGCSAGPLLGF
jgi:hypothetical protein